MGQKHNNQMKKVEGGCLRIIVAVTVKAEVVVLVVINGGTQNQKKIMGRRIAMAWHRLPRRGIFHCVALAARIPGYRGVTMISINF